MWGCFLMSGVKILHFLKDWWKSIPIHQNYTMALSTCPIAWLLGGSESQIQASILTLKRLDYFGGWGGGGGMMAPPPPPPLECELKECIGKCMLITKDFLIIANN